MFKKEADVVRLSLMCTAFRRCSALLVFGAACLDSRKWPVFSILRKVILWHDTLYLWALVMIVQGLSCVFFGVFCPVFWCFFRHSCPCF